MVELGVPPTTITICSDQREDGTEHFQVVRFHGQAISAAALEWARQLGLEYAGEPVPFQLPELLEAIANEYTAFVVEGEKDVESLARIGIVATCNAGGAGKWKKAHSDYLKGADVVNIPDNDKPGRDHAQSVAASSLDGVRTNPGAARSAGDMSDWITAAAPRSSCGPWLNRHRWKSGARKSVRCVSADDRGLNDDEVRAEIGRDDLKQEIAAARLHWSSGCAAAPSMSR